MSEELPMREAMSLESRDWFATRFTRSLNVKLAGAAVGIALALLIAPGSRRLFLAQVGITVPAANSIASIVGRQLGIKPDPFEGRVAVRMAAAAAARHPDDLQVQLAAATDLLPEDKTSSIEKLKRLRALESHFGECPSLYANILRYEAQGEVRVHSVAELCELNGDPVPTDSIQNARTTDTQSGFSPIYATYDQDAAAGERLDPQNAYFPFMRAVGLFGAHRDREAVEAIVRAASKPQWREYYNDELKGQWLLQDEGFVNNSALFHSIAAMSVLFPQYAQMRAAARMTIYTAMKSEQAGHVEEGLSLRANVVRLGSLMRVQSASLIGSLVGSSLTEIALSRPGGMAAIKVNERNEKEQIGKRRREFDTYLQRINAVHAMNTFHTAQQESDEIREIVRQGIKTTPYNQPAETLIVWWVADLITLSNILWLLVLGGLARLFLRSPRLQTGSGLSGYARFVLPVGLIGGALSAPCLLTGISPYFEHIAEGTRSLMLLIGAAPVLGVLGVPATTRKEWGCRLSVFVGSLLFGAILAGCFVWQARGLVGIADLMPIYSNLSGSEGAPVPDLSSRLLLFTPCVACVILIVSASLSPLCHVPVFIGIARGFRGLMIPVSAALFLIYGGMLLFTIRAEAAVQYGLDRTLENEGQYIANQSGKQWPGSGR